MIEVRPTSEIPQPAPVPRLLVELPSRPRVFFGNLRDLVFPRRLPRLELQSAPAPFWPDVFVKGGPPWRRFVDSGACHLIAGGLLIGLTRFFALQPQAVLKPTFDRAQVIVYAPAEYLPPLDTRSTEAAPPHKADPEFARQPIISVPPEADNRTQTIVTPPNVKLKRDVALPNIVAWSDKPEKPRLDIPAPMTLAAEITRVAPQMESFVAPPPDATSLARRREQPNLQSSVAAPPPDVRQSPTTFQGLQPALIAPPPSVEAASTRRLGDLNIGHSAVIAPASQLTVSEQRTMPGGRSSSPVGLAPQVVAPPPALSASGSSGGPQGSRGRVIALNLHPVVNAPPDPPPGNRRGAFAATPGGHAGASGSAGSTTGETAPGAGGHANSSNKEDGSGSGRKGTSNLPAGLYVGNAAPSAKTSPVAGDPGAKTTTAVNPNVVATVRPPRVTSAPPRIMQPDSAAKLSEPERAVFGDRKFYSLTLNMPNLNSAGGSWVIRFAELDHSSAKYGAAKPSADTPAPDLSQPSATRKVDPAYPLQLMRENVAGTVILYAVIHADGTVGNVRVLRGVDDRLDRFASEAVAQWQFHPATKNGSPVDVEATFHIPFQPPRVGSNF
ncbi:MAG TPA: TonB family protein [Candidatus Sulfotelmatobacter sp.]|nr:TonB family protein [Candidatus Sulfotelmatobacter sp.]